MLSQPDNKIASKFIPHSDTPFVTVDKLGTTTYKVANKDDLISKGTYHVSALSKYRFTVLQTEHTFRR